MGIAGKRHDELDHAHDVQKQDLEDLHDNEDFVGLRLELGVYEILEKFVLLKTPVFSAHGRPHGALVFHVNHLFLLVIHFFQPLLFGSIVILRLF